MNQTYDGGYLITGSTSTCMDNYTDDVWLIKMSTNQGYQLIDNYLTKGGKQHEQGETMSKRNKKDGK